VGSSYRARARRARAELQYLTPGDGAKHRQNRKTEAAACEARQRFETSFYGSVSGYNFAWQI